MNFYLPRIDAMRFMMNRDHNNYTKESYELIDMIYEEMKCIEESFFDDWVNIFKKDKYIIANEYNEIINIISKKESWFSKEEIGKRIDNEYVVSECSLLEHSYPGFVVIHGETYDYFIGREIDIY